MVQKVIGKTWLNLKEFSKDLFKEKVHTKKFSSELVFQKDNTLNYFYKIFNRAKSFMSRLEMYVSTMVIENVTKSYFKKISESQNFKDAFKVFLLSSDQDFSCY